MANSIRSKHSNEDIFSIDRISALPESLLCHILSLLPTHYAVQTSILSKTWKHLWTSITSLDFDEDLFPDPNLQAFADEGENKRFVQLVYKALALLRTPCLQNFRLSCTDVQDPFHVNTWAGAALSRDVRELVLIVYPREPFDFPVSLFSCKTLSSLALDCYTTLNIPNSVCLPNLKIMHLGSLKYANDESFPKLLSGCPVLENLSVQRLEMDNIFNFNISSLTLKHIDLNFVSNIEPDSPQCTLQIDAPALEYLGLNDHVSNDFIIGKLSSLVEANISVHLTERNNVENGYGDQVRNLLNGLSNVKFLSLSGVTLKALSYAREQEAPTFHNLTRLTGVLRTSFMRFSWYIEPHHMPKYLLSRLTAIKISGFNGSADEMKMVKFILNGAKALKRMTINTRLVESEAKVNLLREMTMLPRYSKLCELAVH